MKEAYLTIDDGPSIGRRKRVDVLKKYGIQAVWFSMGKDMEERPEDVVYTIENGGIIGNHFYSHPNFSSLSLEQCQEEIAKTDKIIDEFYLKLGKNRPFKAFRFPYGNKGVEKAFYDYNYTKEERERVQSIQEIIKANGYTSYPFEGIHYKYYDNLIKQEHMDWYWTYDAMEWCIFQEKNQYGIRTIDDVIELMELDLPEQWMGLQCDKSNEVVVIHDHKQTIDTFEPIIQGLIEHGIKFKTF